MSETAYGRVKLARDSKRLTGLDYIKNIFKENEVDKESNLHFLQIANSDKKVAFYDLDVVISVGYRVKSIAGTRFRQWATKVLRAILLEGVKRDYRLEALQSLKDGSAEQATRLTQAGRKLAAHGDLL